MAKDQPTFEIETGPYREKVTAPNPDLAIEAFWQKKDQSKAGDFIRYREVPWNTDYKWDAGKEKRRGSWRYIAVTNGER